MPAVDHRRGPNRPQDSDQHFRFLFEQVGVGVAETETATGRYLRVNRRFCEILGYSQEELAGLDFTVLTHPDDLAADLARMQRLAAGELDSCPLEKRYVRKDGGVVWVELTVSPLRQPGEPLRNHLAVITDITARKEAEAALRESEDRYRDLVENSQDLICTHDVEEGRLLSVNRGAVAALGYPREVLLGMTLADLTTPASRVQLPAYLAGIRARGTAEGVMALQTASGSVLYWEFRNSLRDTGVAAPIVRGIARDVTARRRAERALRKSEAMLREAQRIARAGSWSVVIATGVVWWSDEMYRIFGIDRAAFTGNPADAFMAALHPDDRAGVAARMQAAVASGDVVDDEFRIVHPDGRILHCAASAEVVRDGAGRAVRIQGSTQNITDRKRAAEALDATRANLSAIADSSTVGILVLQDARPVFVNQYLADLLGYSVEELTQTDAYDHVADPAERQTLRELHERRMAGEAVASGIETTLRTRDGRDIPVQTHATRIIWNGQPAGSVFITEISARVEAEQQRQLLEAQLRQAQKLEAIGTLAGGIAHDFNNILGAIVGHVEVASHHVGANAAVARNLDGIRRASGRARKLVAQILSFSRQQSQQQQVSALEPIVTEAVGLLRAIVPMTIEFGVTVAPQLPNVLADATQIHQVVMNLCTNAWQAMADRPGRIDVSLAGVDIEPDHAARLPGGVAPGRYARLSVIDTGSGMDSGTLEQIFEPFFTTKEVGKGTGLGLSVVHGIVKGHGGAIDVRSAVGLGTQFDLYFPAVAAALADVGHRQPEVGSGRGRHVVFVDDEEDLVLLAEEMLGILGYRVSGYRRAADALVALHANPGDADLIVSDLSMPGLSGLEFAGEVAGVRRDLPVVLMSGYVTDEVRAQAAKSGVRTVLHKPLEMRALATIIEELINPVRA